MSLIYQSHIFFYHVFMLVVFVFFFVFILFVHFFFFCFMYFFFFFFFFSSRRRHTRSLRDWSSDVCSSDLRRGRALARPAVAEAEREALEDAPVEPQRHALAAAAGDHVAAAHALGRGDRKSVV